MSQVIMRTTNIGALRKNEQRIYGLGIKLSSFMLGTLGHDVSNNLPVVPDLSLSEVPGAVQTSLFELPSNALRILSARQFEIVIELPVAQSFPLVSSIGIFGKVTHVPQDRPQELLGTEHLHYIANFSSFSKLAGETRTMTFRVTSM